VQKLFPPNVSRPLSISDGHVDEFGVLFESLDSRWVKVERMPEYDESDFEGYRWFKRGDYVAGAHLVQEMVRGQTDVYDKARAGNISMTRIRIFDLPLSDYLTYYEIPAYEADIECGEAILFVASADVEDLLSAGLIDYVLFDDRCVVTLQYDETTLQLREARLVDDPVLVRGFLAVTADLISRAVPMKKTKVYQDALARRSREGA
jgi:hypothetical protein